jgi:glycosyltransferase involved in cell wall biosynthesis
VINSLASLERYGRCKFSLHLINVFGEWDDYRHYFFKNNVEVIELNKFKITLPIHGFIKSRVFYIFISIISIYKVFKLIKKNSPDYFIIHLITMPILFISRFFKFNTKFILRISGYPILNFFRKFLWLFLSKNIFHIISPTVATKNLLIKNNIISQEKISVIEDPILKIRDLPVLRNIKSNINYDYILAVGRLTTQKNFMFLIESFSKIKKARGIKTKLIIIGSGEDKKKLNNLIEKNGMSEFIIILNYQNSVINYIYNAKFLVSTSLWEDPGFVLFEAAINNVSILSSNCPSGPREFLANNKNGLLFKVNDFEDFEKKFIFLINNTNNGDIIRMKIDAKKYCKKYTIFQNYKKFSSLLTR